jgi:hypothetical protein
MPQWEQVTQITNLLQACTPGNLIHLKMGVSLLDDALTAALLPYVDTLETLDITLYSSAEEGLNNLARVLERCQRLKSFTLENYRFRQPALRLFIILEALKSDRLESLTLIGFMSEGRHAYDQKETDDEGEEGLGEEYKPFVLGVPDLAPRNTEIEGEYDDEDEWEREEKGEGNYEDEDKPKKGKEVSDADAFFDSQGHLPLNWRFVEEDRSRSYVRADVLFRTIAIAFVLDKPLVKEMVLNCEVYKKVESSE